MKKRLGLILASTLIGGAAFAGTPSVEFQLRAELQQNSSDDDSSAAVDENNDERSRRFHWEFAKVKMSQKFSDSLSGTIRFKLNENAQSNYNDKMGNWIDFAYIDHKMSDTTKIRVGKQKFAQGGWEGTYSAQDLYGATSHTRAQTNGGSYSKGFYVSGLSYAMDTEFGHFDVQIGDADQAHGEANSSGLLYGLRWEGSFMGGMLNPIVTYHGSQTTEQKDATGTTTSDATTNTVAAVGIQYKNDGLKVELDQVMAAAPSRTSAGKDTKMTSTVFRASKMFGKWNPILKYTMSEYDDGLESDASTTGYKQTDMAFTVEYHPVSDAKFHYYFGMNQETKAPTVDAGTDVATGKTYVGFSSVF